MIDAVPTGHTRLRRTDCRQPIEKRSSDEQVFAEKLLRCMGDPTSTPASSTQRARENP